MTTGSRRLGEYELQERLGDGGMGEVWKAFDPKLQRYVAIKLLHADLQNDNNFMNRFVREARVVASLHHPNIVQVHDFQISRPPESENTIAYMVMDYIKGQTLASYIKDTSAAGRFPPPADIVNLFSSISLAIDYAHQRGMVHRDLKPANILLDARNTTRNHMGEPILTDFGIAKMLGTSTGAMSGLWLGTPLYISPEQAQGYPGNERSDLYSLGIILYEICTGALPFRGESSASIMSQHINTFPPPPALINPSIAPPLVEVILRSIAKDPAARFRSASSMAAAIAEALNVPVPELLGQPTYPVNTLDGPTERKSLPLSLPSGVMPSSPLPAVALSTPQFAGSVSAGQGSPATSAQYLSGSRSSIHSAEDLPTMVASKSIPRLSPLMPPAPASKRRRRGLLLALLAILLLGLLGSALTAYLIFNHSGASSARQVVGHVFFLSSGQLGKNSNQGTNDELEINLVNIPTPAPGKTYYAWLLSDKNQSLSAAILLTTLTVNQGKVQTLYKDLQHTNLLTNTCCFLVTQEDAAIAPINPSPDRSTWFYYGEIPQIADPADAYHYSILDHLRHLLANDPNLAKVGLAGGLNAWLVRNTGNVLEWSGAARDYWKSRSTTLMRDELVRILDYLDGEMDVQVDLPGVPVLAPPKVGLLELDKQNQDPPGYLDSIGRHMQGVANAPGVTVTQRELAIKINRSINSVTGRLKQVRLNALQLVTKNDEQLLLPSSLSTLNDMQTQAFYAYIGRLDPFTNEVEEGVTQISYDIQRLATFDIVRFSS